jgi:hypothetical protein
MKSIKIRLKVEIIWIVMIFMKPLKFYECSLVRFVTLSFSYALASHHQILCTTQNFVALINQLIVFILSLIMRV